MSYIHAQPVERNELAIGIYLASTNTEEDKDMAIGEFSLDLDAFTAFVEKCVSPFRNKVVVKEFRAGFSNNKMHRIEWASDTKVKPLCYPRAVLVNGHHSRYDIMQLRLELRNYDETDEAIRRYT